jgi:hypothetical protein
MGSCLLEPTFRLGLCHDRQDLDLSPYDIIEHAELADAEPVLGLSHPSKPLDPAPAELHGLMPKVSLHRIPYLRTIVCLEPAKIGDRLAGKDDLVAHSGSRIAGGGKVGKSLLAKERPLVRPDPSRRPGCSLLGLPASRRVRGGGQLVIDVPETIFLVGKADEASLGCELKVLAAVKLYELGRLTSGRPGELAGMSRVEFLSDSGRYKVFLLEAELRDLEAGRG